MLVAVEQLGCIGDLIHRGEANAECPRLRYVRRLRATRETAESMEVARFRLRAPGAVFSAISERSVVPYGQRFAAYRESDNGRVFRVIGILC